jgi:streptomycin 3"-adenylyltransferase
VRSYCRQNLAEYWSLVLQATETSLEDGGVSGYWVSWVALGPIRLWHTLLTGEIVSKTEGSQLAAERWPDLAAALMDIRAARVGADVPLGRAHATAAVNLGRRILTDLRVKPGR